MAGTHSRQEPTISRRRDEAVEAVRNRLFEFDSGVRELERVELDRYKNRAPYVGWRLRVRFTSGVEELDFFLDIRFPRTPPRVALVSKRADKVFPHVEKDGVLCLYPSTAAFAISSPRALVNDAIANATRLVEDSIAGRNVDDLRAEFLSYWELYGSTVTPSVMSILEPTPGTRVVSVWCGAKWYVVGEKQESIANWLHNRFGKSDRSKFATVEALLLWLERPLVPDEYPRSASDVLELAKRAGDSGPGYSRRTQPRRPIASLSFSDFRHQVVPVSRR